jgi:D-hydroxyproline dehydrogenase subunit gamma
MSDTVPIFINGERHDVPAAISVAAALLAVTANPRFRHTRRGQEPRGMFCGMGVCFDCLVTIDDLPDQRACMIPVAEGMRIQTA